MTAWGWFENFRVLRALKMTQKVLIFVSIKRSLGYYTSTNHLEIQLVRVDSQKDNIDSKAGNPDGRTDCLDSERDQVCVCDTIKMPLLRNGVIGRAVY